MMRNYLVGSLLLLVSFSGAAEVNLDKISLKTTQTKNGKQKKESQTEKNAEEKKTMSSQPTVKASSEKTKNTQPPCSYHSSQITIGPYLNKDDLYDGSELIVNLPNVRESAQLLMLQHQIDLECAQLGVPLPPYPRLTLSGNLESQVIFNNPYTGKNSQSIDFDYAELDAYVQGTPWLSGYLAIDYSQGSDNNDLELNRAFITVGQLSKSPFYATIGRIYLPFGNYSTNMLSDPTTKVLGRTLENAIVLGYQPTQQNAFRFEVYADTGLTKSSTDNHFRNGWGADAGYSFKYGELGASYLSDLADSIGIQNAMNPANENNGVVTAYAVPAVDVYAKAAFAPLSFTAEYLTAIKHFAVQDIAFQNQGAQPSAFNLEATYAFNSFSKPSGLTVGYGGTQQAVEISLPRQFYEVTYNINILKDTNLGLEYRHDINYRPSDASEEGPSINTQDLGKSDNVVTVQLDFWF